MVSNVRINYTDLLYTNDTRNYYLDEKNMEKIRYMNVYDGESCEREIYHRFRTVFMNLKYYITNLQQLPIAIITSIFIIIFCELFFSKRIIFVLFISIICFICYVVYYLIDLDNYNNFKKEIMINNNL